MKKLKQRRKMRQPKRLERKLDDDVKLKMSVEVDRRRVEIDAEIRSEMRESNELSRYEKVEANRKDEAAKAVGKQLNDELKLESMAEVCTEIP